MSEYASEQMDNVPEGQVQDDSYVTGGNESIPVQSDNATLEDPIQASSADTDQQLGRYPVSSLCAMTMLSSKCLLHLLT